MSEAFVFLNKGRDRQAIPRCFAAVGGAGSGVLGDRLVYSSQSLHTNNFFQPFCYD